jgi:hypothetical protein
VRWQLGDTLYFVAAESTAAGGGTYYGGEVSATDLCSVSGCKPNYLAYDAPPGSPGVNHPVVAGTGSDDGSLRIVVPLSALGNPTGSSLFEEVTAFVTASPQGGAVPQNNGADFADIAPLQLEGTKTFNYRFGAPAGGGVAAPLTPGTPATPSTPTVAKPGGGNLAATGLGYGAPALALVLLALGVLGRRRRIGS